MILFLSFFLFFLSMVIVFCLEIGCCENDLKICFVIVCGFLGFNGLLGRDGSVGVKGEKGELGIFWVVLFS